jgi:hypothetical protein
MAMAVPIGVRWTIGDVSERGFAALRLSIHGALRLFGAAAEYLVLVNTVPLGEARRRLGPLPRCVRLRRATLDQVPAWLARAHLERGMAEGVAWKFAPLTVFEDRFELALDNDVILWSMPAALARWLDEAHATRCLLAEDVRPGFGRFAPLCGEAPRNSGIRGLPPRFDLSGALRATLARSPGVLASELDEQGLQVAALSCALEPRVVSARDVTICSPFPPHAPELGRAGAHFVGLNARRFPWRYDGRPAEVVRAEHFDALAPELARRVGLGA